MPLWSVGFALLMSVLAMAAGFMVVDIDLFHEMALFREFLFTGRMPLTDQFAYTPTLPKVVHHEWATGAVLYAATVGTGWGAGGLVALKYGLCFGICIGCFGIAAGNGASLPMFGLLGLLPLCLVDAVAFTNIRAQLFTLAFLVVLFGFIDLDRKGNRSWIFVWLPVVVIWSNMHAGVVSGIGILVFYGISRFIDEWIETRSAIESLLRIKHLVLAGVASALAININPYGWDYVPYLVRALRMDRPLIQEWLPIHQVASMKIQLMFLGSMLIAIYAILGQPKRLVFEAAVLLLTAYLTMKNFRHLSLYAVTWACLVPPLMERTVFAQAVRKGWQRHADKIAVACLACGLISLGSAIKSKFWELQIPAEVVAQTPGLPVFPVGAVNYLREQNFEGNLFVPFETGAFVSWNLYPQVKVSLDSRYEVAYPDGAVDENWKFYAAQDDWQRTLAKYPTDAVLVPLNKPILKVLDDAAMDDPNFAWQPVYRDLGCALFAKTGSSLNDRIAEESSQTIHNEQRR
jgi:hypothetical protein